MNIDRIPGKLRQLSGLSLLVWPAFIRSWLTRKRTGTVACAFPLAKRLISVPVEDFYRSYHFFAESIEGRNEIRFFLSKFRPSETVFDIGGFCGAYSMASKALQPETCKVVVFEPLPTNASRISIISELNGFSGIQLRVEAVSDSSMLAGKINEASGMIRDGDEEATANATFSACSLDDFVNSTGIAPTIIKLDVDGFEQKVLNGAIDCLRRIKPRLWIELHPRFLRNNGCHWRDLVKLIEVQGYTVSFWSDFDGPGREVSFHIWCE